MIERDRNNQKTQSSLAALAVVAMRKDPVSDEVEELERRFWNWLGVKVNDDQIVIEQTWHTSWRRRILEWLPPFTWFRRQIELLATAYTKASMDVKNQALNAGWYQEYLRLVEDNKELRTFLHTHYHGKLEAADSLKTPLLTVVKELLLQAKEKADGPTGTTN